MRLVEKIMFTILFALAVAMWSYMLMAFFFALFFPPA